jgi:phosphoglycerate dehydrogenase-like enzyme
MEFSRPPLVVAFELSEKRKAIVADALAGVSAVVYLTELDEVARAEALRNAGVLLTFNTSKELRSGEAALLAGARLIQFMIGGVDFIPLGELPKGVPVATNGGGYAESMAEHALAMALAAAKRLILEHESLKLGQFNQFTQNRMLAGHGVMAGLVFGRALDEAEDSARPLFRSWRGRRALARRGEGERNRIGMTARCHGSHQPP